MNQRESISVPMLEILPTTCSYWDLFNFTNLEADRRSTNKRQRQNEV